MASFKVCGVCGAVAGQYQKMSVLSSLCTNARAIRATFGVLVTAISLISVIGRASAVNTRNNGRRYSANACVKANRVINARICLRIVAVSRNAIQVARCSLHARIGGFVGGRRSTLRRLLIGRRATTYLNDGRRRRASGIEDRSQP